MTHEAKLYHTVEDQHVVCDLCHHRCRIAPGKRGVCRARLNENGRLVSLVYGRCIAMNADPIEKKPLFHFLPGSLSFSVATVGCNFRCSFCQNYLISQSLSEAEGSVPGETVSPDELVRSALKRHCHSISYTYTEPTVFFEYALETAQLATAAGLGNCFVSNGFMTPEAVDAIAPYLDAINVDLKSFNPEVYRKIMGGRLEGVLDTLAYLHKKGIWLEVTTLVVEDMNDSEEEIRQIARFIAGLSRDIPWHVSRFFPQYKMTATPPTAARTIADAVRIGEEEGLRFVYCGNARDERHESTRCAQCGTLLIGRSGYFITTNTLKPDGACPSCGTQCPGVWRLDKKERKPGVYPTL